MFSLRIAFTLFFLVYIGHSWRLQIFAGKSLKAPVAEVRKNLQASDVASSPQSLTQLNQRNAQARQRTPFNTGGLFASPCAKQPIRILSAPSMQPGLDSFVDGLRDLGQKSVRSLGDWLVKTSPQYGDDLFAEQRSQIGTWLSYMNAQYPGIGLLHEDPDTLVIDDFLDDEEIDYLIDIAKPNLQSSQVVGESDEEKKESLRSSSSCFLPKSLIGEVLQKVSMLTNKSVADMEPQVGHYGPGQFFNEHYDAVDMSSERGKQFVSFGGNRLVTVIVYLNDVESGGHTIFDSIDLEVQPEKGKAIVFFPATLDARVDKRLSHKAAAPQGDSEKWILQVWIREGATNFE